MSDLISRFESPDLPGDTSTTGTLSAAGSVTGEIESSGDTDWYQVSLSAGITYTFSQQGSPTSAGTLSDPLLRLYDSWGILVSVNDDRGTGRNAQLEFTPTSTGTYYASAEAFGTNTGTYTLGLTSTGGSGDDYAADSSTNGSVGVGISSPGNIERAGDIDWFAVSLTAGTDYAISQQGSPSGQGTLSDPLMRVYDSSGALVATNDDGGTGLDALVGYTPTVSGTYYIAAGGYVTATGSYVVAVTTNSSDGDDGSDGGSNDSGTGGTSDDYAGDSNTTGTISGGSEVTGNIESIGDTDWFAVNLIAGNAYLIGQLGGATSQGTLADPFLRLYDSTSTLVGRNDNANGTRNAELSFVATSTGVHYISAEAFGTDTGTYTLAVVGDTGSGTTTDDYTNDSSTGGAASVGGSVQGDIETSGDRDWFALPVTAGTDYVIDLKGEPSSVGTLSDPVLSLLTADGTNLAVNDDNGTNQESTLSYTATSTQTLYLAASGFGSATGTYTLSVASSGGTSDSVGSDTTTGGTITVGSPVSGAIDFDQDADWYALSVAAGTAYTIDLTGRRSGDGTLRDPLLRLYDAAGALVTTNDDGGARFESQLVYAATAAGTVYLSAEAFYGTGTYRLAVTSTTDDAGGDTTTGGTLSLGQALTGSLERSGDTDWYRISLTAGHYQITGRGADSSVGTLADPVVILRDANGTALGGDDDNGTGQEALALISVSQAGDYYVEMRSGDDGTGTYELQMTALANDVPGDSSTTSTLATAGSISGTVDIYGDADWYRFDVTSGQSYHIDLKGAPSNAGTLGDPFLALYDSDGSTLLALDDDSGTGLESQLTYTASSTETLFVAAAAYGTGTGTYTLSTSSLSGVTDDYSADINTTGAAAIGGSVSGTVNYTGDDDWFALDLPANTAVTIALAGSGASPLSRPTLSFYAATGTQINGYSASVDGGSASLTTIGGDTASRVYIGASAASGTGGYAVSVTAISDDYAGSAATTGTVTTTTSATGSLELGGDTDWFAMTVTAGSVYTFALAGSGNNALADPLLRLYDANSMVLAQNDDASTGSLNSAITYAPAVSGTIYASAEAAFSGATGDYQLSVATAGSGSDDYGNKVSDAGSISLGSPAVGSLEQSGDLDWFGVDLTANTGYAVTLKGSSSGLGTLPDPVLKIYDAAGTLVSEHDNSALGQSFDLDPSTTFTPTASGRFYFEAGSAMSGDTGTYQLGVSTLSGASGDDHPDAVTDSGLTALSTASATASRLGTTTDKDVFQLDSIANSRYTITVSGDNKNIDALDGISLRVLDSTGALLSSASGDITEQSATLTYAIATAGTYFLEVSGIGSDENRVGDYSVTLAATADDYGSGGASDDLSNDTGTTGRLTIGGTATGNIERSDDSDWFSIPLVAANTYRLDVKGSTGSGGTNTNPAVAVFDHQGNQLSSNDDGGEGNDAQLVFTAPATDTYFIAVRGSEGARGTYTTSIQTLSASGSDPLFDQQWHLVNTGQMGGPAGIDINVTGAWADYSGAGINVGVMDQGVQSTHPDLQANSNTTIDYDAREDDNNADAEDSDSSENHGVAVAGLIGADRFNGVGVVGVAHDAELTGLRIGFGSRRSTQFDDAMARYYQFDVVNNSWGYATPFSDDVNNYWFQRGSVTAIRKAVEEGRDGKGTVLMFAAGNARDEHDNTNYHALGNMRELINVAALDFDGEFSAYSTPGASLLITSPGSGYSGTITTTDRVGSVGYSSADYTPSFRGTSAATPIASGVVALMLEANTNLSYRDVQDILALSATQTDADSSGWRFNGASNWNGGGMHVSHDYGFGLIDATAAVRLAETWTTGKLASNEQSVTATGAGSLSIPDNSSSGASQSVSVNADFDVEWVEVAYTFAHSNASHLTMTLTSPSGTEATLLETPTFSSLSSASNLSYTATSTFYRNESSQGSWTLKVVDSQSGLSGSLASWELRVYGAAGTASDTYFYTDEFGTLTDSARRVLNDGSGTDAINASAVSTAVTMNLAAGASSIIAGQTLTITGSTTIENLITGSGADTITGNSVANTINAGRGGDTINASGGNDTIEGGPGLDTIIYAGVASGYTVTDNGNGNTTVVDTDTSDGDTGTDTLSGIETISFSDTNGSGAGASTLSVSVPNSAPTVANQIADQTVLTDGSQFSFGLPTNTFTDADSGDTLTYTASTASGALPSWLGFDANTQILSGTATAADVGTTAIVVTATDQQGASVTDAFNITVNDASTTPVDVVRFFNFTVGSHTFTISDAEENNISSTQTDRFTRDGVAFKAFGADSDNTDPVYRIENKSTGAVLFTTDVNERNTLINNFSDTFGDLGVAYYAYTSPPAGDNVQTVVRYRSEATGGHFLTSNISERTFVDTELSGLYTYEGIAFYTIA